MSYDKIVLYEGFSYRFTKIQGDSILLPSCADLSSIFLNTEDASVSYTINGRLDFREEPIGREVTVKKKDKVYSGILDRVEDSNAWIKAKDGYKIIRGYDEIESTHSPNLIKFNKSLSQDGIIGYRINGLTWYPKYSCIIGDTSARLILESIVINDTREDFSSINKLCLGIGSITSHKDTTAYRSINAQEQQSSEGPTFYCYSIIDDNRKIYPYTTSCSRILMDNINIMKTYVYYCNGTDVFFGLNFVADERLPSGQFAIYQESTLNPIGISFMNETKEKELRELTFGTVGSVNCKTEQTWESKKTLVTVEFDRKEGEPDHLLIIKFPFYGKLSSYSPDQGIVKNNCITWNLGNEGNTGKSGKFTFTVTLTE